MKTLAMLALAAGVCGIGGSAASAAALSPAARLTAPSIVTPVCDCRDGNDVPSFYSGFVDTPYDGPSPGYYGTSGFYGERFGDEDGAAPPYAYFPDRYRSERLWGWPRRPQRGYGYVN
jgi:hypothetical protein